MEPSPLLPARLWLNAGLGLLTSVLVVMTVVQGRHGARMRHTIRSTPASIEAHLSRPQMRPLDDSGDRVIRSYLADVWSDSPDRLWIVQDVATRRRLAPAHRPSEAAAGDAEDLMHDIVGGSVDLLIVSGAVVHVEPLDWNEARRVQNVPLAGEDEPKQRHYYSHEDDRSRRPFYASGIIELCCRRRQPSVEPIRVFPTDAALDEGVPHMSAATAPGGDEDDIRRWRTPRRYHVVAYHGGTAYNGAQ